jgi:hypothetical protein
MFVCRLNTISRKDRKDPLLCFGGIPQAVQVAGCHNAFTRNDAKGLVFSVKRIRERTHPISQPPGRRRFQMNEVRGALAVARAEARRDDLRIRQRERGARPFAFKTLCSDLCPDVQDSRVHEKIVDVPKTPLALPAVARDPRAESVLTAPDVEIVSARESEYAQRADANLGCPREEKDEGVRAAVQRFVVIRHDSSNLAVKWRK